MVDTLRDRKIFAFVQERQDSRRVDYFTLKEYYITVSNAFKTGN
jgi:hypothetical protein